MMNDEKCVVLCCFSYQGIMNIEMCAVFSISYIRMSASLRSCNKIEIENKKS